MQHPLFVLLLQSKYIRYPCDGNRKKVHFYQDVLLFWSMSLNARRIFSSCRSSFGNLGGNLSVVSNWTLWNFALTSNLSLHGPGQHHRFVSSLLRKLSAWDEIGIMVLDMTRVDNFRLHDINLWFRRRLVYFIKSKTNFALHNLTNTPGSWRPINITQ